MTANLAGMDPPGLGPDGRDRAGSATFGSFLPIMLLIVVASAVVAISGNGLRLLLPPADLEGPWVWGVRFGGAVAAITGVAAFITRRRRCRREGRRTPDLMAGSLRRAATIMGLLTLVALLVRPPLAPADPLRFGPQTSREETQPNDETGADSRPQTGFPGDRGGSRGSGGGGSGGGPGRPVSVAGGAQPQPSLLERLTQSLPLNLLLLVALVSFFVLMRRRRRPEEALPVDFPPDQEDAEAGLEASLAEVSGEGGNPRDQITAAYVRLITTLAAAGAARQVQEAPHEHLHRTLGPLGVHPEPLHQLTELYVMAQFSERPVTERHRAVAVHALEVSLACLRETFDSLRPEGDFRFPEEAPA